MKKLLLGLLASLWATVASAGVNCTMPFVFIPGTLADANQVNADFNAVVSCLLNAAAAGNNNDITALLALTTPITPAQGGTPVFLAGTSTGLANAQTVTAAPVAFTLNRGNSVVFTAGFTNTGAMTLNANGTGATNVFRASPNGPQALTGGEVIAGNLIWATYDGTQFQIISNGPQFGGFGPQLSVASTATTDLGTVPTHNVVITGVSAIASFGSSASTTFPLYRIAFSGALTLTYNATSMILPGANNITTAPNDTAVAMYLGSGNWQVISYSPATGVPVVAQRPACGFSQLALNNGSSNSIINWSFNSGSAVNALGTLFTAVGATSGTVNITTGTGGTSTAGGMDGSAAGNNQFIALWLIYNGTTWSAVGTKNSFPTLPSFPSGYFAACYMGSFKTNGAGNLFGQIISGNTASYVVGGANIGTGCPSATCVLPQIITGTQGSNCATTGVTYATATPRGNNGATVWMPLSAPQAIFLLDGAAGGNTMVVPNPNYTGGAGPGTGALANVSIIIPMNLESNTVSYCSSAGGAILAQYGWKDAVNAN